MFNIKIPSQLITDLNYSRILESKLQYNQIQLANWLNDDLSKWTWWLNLIAIIIPIIILWKLLDQKRLLQILVFGLLIAILSTFLDAIGECLMLWFYPDRFLPISPRLLPIDFITLPFFYMLVYQYFTQWKNFIMANIILSAINSFVLEPLLVWLNLYQPINWHYFYSFPIYIAIPILIRWLTEKLVAKDTNYRLNGTP
jgi:hypothetical protein